MRKKIRKKIGIFDRKKLIKIARFLIIFNLLAIPLYLAIFLDLSITQLQTFFSILTYHSFKIFGYQITQDGYWLTIFMENGIRKIEISWDSTGWKSAYALVALIIATPISNFHKKLKFIPIGVLIIFFINYLRITTTILISLKFGFEYFDIVHLFLWREGLILFVVLIWYLWFRKERYNY